MYRVLLDTLYVSNLRPCTRSSASLVPDLDGFGKYNFLAKSARKQITDENVPRLYSETKCQNAPNWTAAMVDEMNVLINLGGLELVKLPKDKKPVQHKRVNNYNKDGQAKIVRLNGKLVAKEFTQVVGKDYFDLPSPVSMYATLRLMIGLSV